MENTSTNTSNNKRILVAVGIVILFVVCVLVWYFVYFKPNTTPSISGTNNPIPSQISPPRFQFITWGNNSQENQTSTTEITNPLAKPLVKIWNKPATGQTFITDQILKEIKETIPEGTTTKEITKTIRATSTIVIFVDKTTGYIYGYPVETGKIFQISNTIIPGVYDAYFLNNGRQVIMRYLDQKKQTVSGLVADVPRINQGGDASPLENTTYLPSVTESVAVNSTHTELSYSITNTNGSAVYSLSSSKKPTLVTSSPFKEWVLSYGGKTIYVTSKPSAYSEGFTFTLPLFEAEVVEKTGLMTTPSSSGILFNSMWGRNGLVTFFSKKGITNVLSIVTLAPKCSFEKSENLICGVPRSLSQTTEGLPDDWFQGRISFEDDLVIVNKNTGDSHTLYSFTEEDGLFDVIKIEPSEDDMLFSFINKKDENLWLLNTSLIQGD